MESLRAELKSTDRHPTLARLHPIFTDRQEDDDMITSPPPARLHEGMKAWPLGRRMYDSEERTRLSSQPHGSGISLELKTNRFK